MVVIVEDDGKSIWGTHYVSVGLGYPCTGVRIVVAGGMECWWGSGRCPRVGKSVDVMVLGEFPRRHSSRGGLRLKDNVYLNYPADASAAAGFPPPPRRRRPGTPLRLHRTPTLLHQPRSVPSQTSFPNSSPLTARKLRRPLHARLRRRPCRWRSCQLERGA